MKWKICDEMSESINRDPVQFIILN